MCLTCWWSTESGERIPDKLWAGRAVGRDGVQRGHVHVAVLPQTGLGHRMRVSARAGLELGRVG